MPWSTSSRLPWAASKRMRLALAERLVQQARGVRDVRPQLLGVAQVFVADGVGVERPGRRRQRLQAGGSCARTISAQPFAQMIGVQQLADADAADPADLVLVARADAAAGGADGLAAALLAAALFLQVIGEDDVGVVADEQVVADRRRRPCAGCSTSSRKRGG